MKQGPPGVTLPALETPGLEVPASEGLESQGYQRKSCFWLWGSNSGEPFAQEVARSEM